MESSASDIYSGLAQLNGADFQMADELIELCYA